MYQGRFSEQNTAAPAPRRRRRRKLSKSFLLLMAVILLIGCAAGATVAYLAMDTDPVENTFQKGWVDCEVQSDRTVKNTGNVAAKIRAAVTVTYTTEDSNIILGVTPSYTLVGKGAKWSQGADGYYYYSDTVPVGGFTEVLFTDVSSTAPDGYKVTISVVAEALQADGPNGNTPDVW